MRRLAALLLALVCATAAAADDTYYVARNKNGGRIVLTFLPCNEAKPDERLFYMYTASPDGRALEGCWTLAMDQVQVAYKDGTRYTYDPEGFTKVEGRKPSGRAL